MSQRPTTSAIVLAGGRGSRFGGDKLVADLAGRPVLERTIDAVRPLVDEVLVVGRGGSTRGVAYLADDAAFQGPLAGLETGLRSAVGEVVVVLGGDMALAQPAVLRLLADRVRIAVPGGPAAAVLVESGAVRPLPLALRRDGASDAAEAALAEGGRSLRALLDRLPVAVVDEATWRAVDPFGDTLIDVDTQADLSLARARLEADRLRARA
ncbi:MAG TPA: molybdenum cofactor guanylyltransferase [Candidatus Binatus sp.]|nr:molybdenum cofactor guanylyltransferase [Candidatus Binatus sp.]